MIVKKSIETLGKLARQAEFQIKNMDTNQKNKALLEIGGCLRDQKEFLLQENEKDYIFAKQNGMNEGLLDRLRLTEERIFQIAEGIENIVHLEDPVGKIIQEKILENGLKIQKVSVPLGVIGIIYEARPNVTVDAFGLCFKSGNAVILKGGSDAIHSNIALAKVIREGLENQNITPDAIQMIEDTDRETATEFMKCDQYVDVLIPRGSAALIQTVVKEATIPVIETGSGNCHIYIDESADLKQAVDIVVNAKTQRIGVCNACESLVIHRKCVDTILPVLAKALHEKHVKIFGDENVCAHTEYSQPATTDDYAKEYLDLMISVKTVDSLEQAISHINQYSTGHSECIITKDMEQARLFVNGIDSACVYVNASTRFTDGGEFGMGAEIGISTQKLHARGPMGLHELTTYKYEIWGNGQTRP